jgi:hypothetical protein
MSCCSKVWIGTGDPIASEDLLEFTLIYQGELLGSGNKNPRAKEKHRIRKVFHPQLRRLWKTKNNLRQYATSLGLTIQAPAGVEDSEDVRVEIGIGELGKRWNRAGFSLIPLVTDKYALQCSLDILLLRPQDERLILKQGDLDGQVKTLFDALRIPDSLLEAGGESPTEDESPFYCLLSDDRLISEVKVTSDQLLMLPEHRDVKANDAFAVIRVKLNHRGGGPFDRWFD